MREVGEKGVVPSHAASTEACEGRRKEKDKIQGQVVREGRKEERACLASLLMRFRFWVACFSVCPPVVGGGGERRPGGGREEEW